MTYTVDLVVITEAVNLTMTSLAPLLTAAAALLVAGGVLAWGIGLIKRWD